jgi:hypothetical protein
MNTFDKDDLKFYETYKNNTLHTNNAIFYTNIGLFQDLPESIEGITHMKINSSFNDEVINIYWTHELTYLDLTDFNYCSAGKNINFTFFEKVNIMLIPFVYMFYSLTEYPVNLETLVVKLHNNLLVQLKYALKNVKTFEFNNLPRGLKKIVFLIDTDMDEIYTLNLKQHIIDDLSRCDLPKDCCVYINENLLSL